MIGSAWDIKILEFLELLLTCIIKEVAMQTFLLFLFVLTETLYVPAQLLITNSTVVDVENKKLLPGMDVMVVDGVITAIGKKLSVPAGSKIIDGKGKFLIPGLVDAHVHFFQSGGVFTRPDVVDLRKFKSYSEEITWTHNNMDNTLRRYSRAGITTVVDVGSTVNFLLQRDTFRLKNYTPTVYMTGPLLVTYDFPGYEGLGNDGPFYFMKTVEDARSHVQKELPYKPDFIKIGFVVPGRNKDSTARHYMPWVKAAIDEAHKFGLRVAVHAFQRITAQLAVEAGANHLVHIPFDELISPEFIQLLKDKNSFSLPQQRFLKGTAKHSVNTTGPQQTILFMPIPIQFFRLSISRTFPIRL